MEGERCGIHNRAPRPWRPAGREHQERRGRVCADRFPPSPAHLAGVLRPRHSVGGHSFHAALPGVLSTPSVEEGGAEALCKRSGPPFGVGKQQDCLSSALNPLALWRLLDHWWRVSLPALLWVLCLSLLRLLQGVPGSSSNQGSAFSLLGAGVSWERSLRFHRPRSVAKNESLLCAPEKWLLAIPGRGFRQLPSDRVPFVSR